MANLSLTNAEVLSALGLVMGVSREASDWDATTQDDARNMIRSGLRKFFNCGHLWSFLDRPFTAPAQAVYETGTVTVADGTVTLAAGTWPSWAEDGILRVDGQSVYVIDRTSDSVITINNTALAVAAGATFELHRYRVALPTDFGEFLGGVVYHRANRGNTLRGDTDAGLKLHYAANFRTGETCLYAIEPGRDTDASDYYFSFYPPMDAEAYASGTYRAVPDDQLDDDDLTVDGALVQVGRVHAQTLLEAILAAAEEYYNDGGGVHAQKFEQLLAQSIQHDKRTAGPIQPSGMTPAQARRLSLLFHEPDYSGGVI